MCNSYVGELILIKVRKKIGESYKLQPSLIKHELEHDEIYEDTWKAKEKNGYLMLKITYYQLHSIILDIQRVWRN